MGGAPVLLKGSTSNFGSVKVAKQYKLLSVLTIVLQTIREKLESSLDAQIRVLLKKSKFVLDISSGAGGGHYPLFVMDSVRSAFVLSQGPQQDIDPITSILFSSDYPSIVDQPTSEESGILEFREHIQRVVKNLNALLSREGKKVKLRSFLFSSIFKQLPTYRTWQTGSGILEDILLYGGSKRYTARLKGAENLDIGEKIKSYSDPDYKFSTR